jgi:hypothetical protein
LRMPLCPRTQLLPRIEVASPCAHLGHDIRKYRAVLRYVLRLIDEEEEDEGGGDGRYHGDGMAWRCIMSC